MGSEKTLSNAERKRKWREGNKEKEKEADRIQKVENGKKYTDIEEHELKEKNKLYKQKSRKKLCETESRQKQKGRLLQDRNRKKKEYDGKKESTETVRSTSTYRVKKISEKVKFQFITPGKKRLSGRTERLNSSKLKKSLQMFSLPSRKAAVINNLISAQSPRSTQAIKENIAGDTHVDAASVLKSISRERNKMSTVTQRIFLSQLIQQKQKSIDSATARKLNTSTQLLKLVQNVEIDDLLKHAKLVHPNHGLFHHQKSTWFLQ